MRKLEVRSAPTPSGVRSVAVAIEAIRSAYEALGDGDVEPLVALIHADMEWRGRRRLRQFLRTPS